MTVRAATPDDRTRVLESLSSAFAADPVLRYLFPADELYATSAPVFFGGLFDKRVAAGTAWVADDGLAVAMWDAPDSAGSSDLSALPADALARVDVYDSAVHSALPEDPHWYLGVLGTHPGAAGRGLGRAVMQPGIDAAAAAGLPCVLETSNEANLAFYGRGGWQPVGGIETPVRTWVLQRVNR